MYGAAIVVVSMAMLVAHCHSLSVEDFEKKVGACGDSNIEALGDIAFAKETEFPWNVELYYSVYNNNPNDIQFMCEGILIAPNLVLTTAYCLKSANSSSRILDIARFGRKDLDSLWHTNVPVEKWIVPGDAEGHDLTQRNNIGLIKLQRDVEFSVRIKPICLPLSAALRNRAILNGEKMAVSGWGQSEGGPPSIKRKALVSVIDSTWCANKYGSTSLAGVNISDDHVCAGGEQEEDTCLGYNGTPLMIRDDSTSRWTLFGLASFGPSNCKVTGTPALYTVIGPHIDWILDNAGA